MRIFATVGTQLPFDRLIRELDAWAEKHPHAEVFAQIGQSKYKPNHMRWEPTITSHDFRDHLADCDVVVSHAGMGTIISGVEYGKQVIIMPRRADYGEHRNDHQAATAKRLSHLHGLKVVHSDEELQSSLDDANRSTAGANEQARIPLLASPQLIVEIRNFAGL